MKIQITLVLLLALVSAQTGGWKKQNTTIFKATNSNSINEAQVAVQNKYQPEEQGYEFQQVVSVQTQVVAGTNQNIVLQYENEEGSIQQYDVIIYSAPWNGQDQITKCEQINGQSASFSQTQTINNENDNQQKLYKTKRSSLRLKVRRQDQSNSSSTGTWENINPEVFEQSNDNIINQANLVVAQQYNPEQQGYEFDKVMEVQTQIVSGTNYNIKLLYSNGQGSYQTYDVYLYICPWNPSANQAKATLTGTYQV
ncbi:unnamed protein product [Paramecium pentaurelia]|uniref:Cystatin domain-containing protein n=1 Tax=Paramecium pentaurelia TaxID=43138 RepID=A0A8S1RW49_9CILI|nr:unnamed protein product [Paramecium pentaurelia]